MRGDQKFAPGLTTLLPNFGQFLDHDITFSPVYEREHRRCERPTRAVSRMKCLHRHHRRRRPDHRLLRHPRPLQPERPAQRAPAQGVLPHRDPGGRRRALRDGRDGGGNTGGGGGGGGGAGGDGEARRRANASYVSHFSLKKKHQRFLTGGFATHSQSGSRQHKSLLNVPG